MITADRFLLEQLVRAVGAASQKIRGRDLSLFCGMRGHAYTGDLLVVGRATNGWDPAWEVDQAVDDDQVGGIVQESIDRSRGIGTCPMLWVTHPPGKYNPNRSAFWRVIRDVVSGLGFAGHAGPAWPSSIAWAYRFTPGLGLAPGASAPPQYVQGIYRRAGSSTVFVVARHPQGKKEQRFVAEVLEAFRQAG